MTHFAYSGHFGWIVSWSAGLILRCHTALRNTRKSTKHNLDLAFNSLDAQRGLRGLDQEPMCAVR
jgi:hypothetical protein